MEPNPYAPPVSDPPETELGEYSVFARTVQAVLLGIVIALAALMFLGVTKKAMNAGGFGAYWQDLQTRKGSRGSFVGAAWVYIVCLYWGPVASFWSLTNLVGLMLNAGWTRKSLIVFWSVNILTCWCMPFGLIGLAHVLIARRTQPAVLPQDPSLPWQQPRY